MHILIKILQTLLIIDREKSKDLIVSKKNQKIGENCSFVEKIYNCLKEIKLARDNHMIVLESFCLLL